MSATVHFIVAGPPQPKQRARTGMGGHHYTPAATRSFDLAVGAYALAAAVKAQFPRRGDGAFAVSIDLYMPDARPRDIDNCAKSILDGCNKILWKDDRQVSRLLVNRHIDRAAPRTEVTVVRLEQLALAGGK